MNSAEETSLHCAAVMVLHTYCAHTKSDYSDYLPMLFRGIIRLFTYDNERVLNASWMCLSVITKVSEVKPIRENGILNILLLVQSIKMTVKISLLRSGV